MMVVDLPSRAARPLRPIGLLLVQPIIHLIPARKRNSKPSRYMHPWSTPIGCPSSTRRRQSKTPSMMLVEL
jgi:hypothetical protein